MSDDGSGSLIGLIIILGVIMAVVMLAVFAIFCVMAVGSVVGMVIAVKNFVIAVKETVDERKSLSHFKNYGALTASGGEANYPNLVFEENAAKMYIFGPIFTDIFGIIRNAVSENFEYRMDFSEAESDSTFISIALKVFVVGKGVSVYVFGTMFSILLCLAFLVVCAMAAAVVFPVMGIILLAENIYFKIKQINFRCTVCKKEYKLPRYFCPECGMAHIRLKPGRYGIFRRRCLCGAHLPLIAKMHGHVTKLNSEGEPYREIIELGKMRNQCPFCFAEGSLGLSHAISIALVGGASSGKTTFKVAFQNEFLDKVAGRCGIDAAFPDAESENEYNNSRRYFDGKDFIPGTNGTANADITTFCVNLKNKSFISDRMLQIYDLPGERFLSGYVKESWEHYSFTEGAVFFIDPFSLEKVEEQNSESIRDSGMGICHSDMNAMIDSMITTLNDVRVKKARNGKMLLPIALVIGKCDTDLLDGQCGDAAVKRLMEGAPDVFTNKFDTMDYAVRCFLSSNGYDNFIQNLDNNFENVHFFSCSAVGSVPKKALCRFSPRNVLEIMQWLILRADRKNIGGVWKVENIVNDIPEERKKLYVTNRDYYDKLVVEALPVNNL